MNTKVQKAFSDQDYQYDLATSAAALLKRGTLIQLWQNHGGQGARRSSEDHLWWYRLGILIDFYISDFTNQKHLTVHWFGLNKQRSYSFRVFDQLLCRDVVRVGSSIDITPPIFHNDR